MHGMKKKRVPRIKSNPIVEAMRGASPITGKDLVDLHKVELRAIDLMVSGGAGKADWEYLVEMFNIAETMAKSGIGVELIPIAAEIQVYLCRAYERAQTNGVWFFRPEEAWAVREAWEYHDLQRRSVPMNQYRQFARRTHNIMRTGNGLKPNQILEQVDGL